MAQASFFDQLLDFATHPAVAPHLASMLVDYTAPKRDHHAELEKRISEVEESLHRKRGRPRKDRSESVAVGSAVSGEPITSLADVRDHTVRLAATLKEAARFAREDPDHPDAQRRIADARRMADELTEAERYALAPERVPDGERQAVEAVLPLIRRTRELALNSLGSAAGISDAAAAAGKAATALQVAVATGAVPAGPTTGDPLYARAAKTESGCVECGRAHLAAVAATLRKAAAEAQAKGFGDPDVQSRLAFAQEELAALKAYDWTPDKIARNPHSEQQVLNSYVPEVERLHAALRQTSDPATLARLAAEATNLREGFERELLHKFQMIAVAGNTRDAGVDLSKLELFGLPSVAQVQEVTAPSNSATYFDLIRARLRDRGVRVVYRQPQSGQAGIIIEGEYSPSSNQVSLNPAAMDKEDPYHLQVLIHEGVHALLHNKTCLPMQVITPDVRQRAEDATELAVIAAMTELGMPLEDRDGHVVVPAARQVDWDLLRRNVDPQTFEDVRWATDWVVRAAQGADGELAGETCPALRSVTVPVQTTFVQPVSLNVEPGPFHPTFNQGTLTLTVNQKHRLAEAALKQYQSSPGGLKQFRGPEGYVVRVTPVSGGLGVGLVSPSGEYERILTVPEVDRSLAEPPEEENDESEDDGGEFNRATRTAPDMSFNAVRWQIVDDPNFPGEYAVIWNSPRRRGQAIAIGLNEWKANFTVRHLEQLQQRALDKIRAGESISDLTYTERQALQGNTSPPTVKGSIAPPPGVPQFFTPESIREYMQNLETDDSFERRVIVAPPIGGANRG